MWKDKIAPGIAQSAVSFCGRDRRIWPQNWTRERNRPKISNSAVSFGGQAADHNRRIHPENRGENGGFIRRFRNRRVNRRTQPENNKCIRCETAVSNRRPDRRSNRRIRPETSGPKRRFHSAARPPIKPQIHQKWWIQGESQGNHQERSSRKTKHTYVQARTFSDHQRKTNYHTQTHNKIQYIKVHVWKWHVKRMHTNNICKVSVCN